MIKRLPVLIFSVAAVFSGKLATAQLNINNAQFFIEAGATVTVQGDLTSNTNILGTGKILLKGTANQNVNMGGNTIPNLELDNATNATLTSNARIGSSLTFTNGKLTLGTNNLTLSDVATTTGGGASKFVETNGTGKLVKEITSNLTAYVMPVGTGTDYSPASLTTSGTYTTATASVQAKSGAEPNKHVRSTDYLNRYWTISHNGVAGTVTAAGQYNDPTDVTGTETDLVGMFWNGTSWTKSPTPVNTATNITTFDVPAAGGDLYAMNKFNLLNARAFLQGAFNTGTGLMNDNLRTGTNVIPTTDPYRAVPYNTLFTHVNNTVPETVNPTVFNDLGNDNNIVDWVFLELRNTTTPGNVVLQTRSVLLQKDGDIVDVDGVSPVYFKNVDAGNYTIAIRHRNHLGIATDPTSNPRALSEATPSLTDFSTFTASQIYGGAAAYTVLNGKNVLWGGNANGNTRSNYGTAGNDRATILTDLQNSETGASAPGYWRSDLNMNKIVRYGTAGNDRSFLLSNVLGSVETASRLQTLPQ